MISDTSYDAFVKVRPKISKSQEAVLAVIRSHPEGLTSSPAASPASPPPKPDEEKERAMTQRARTQTLTIGVKRFAKQSNPSPIPRRAGKNKNMNLPINQIINADCLEVLKTFPDKSVDLVITSPPYNMGNKSLGYHPNSSTGDNFYDEYEDDIPIEKYEQFLIDIITNCIRVSKYTFWNMQSLANNKDTIINLQYHFRDNLKDIFIWNKHAVSQISKGVMAKGWEYVFIFGEDSTIDFKENNFPENNYVPNRQTWYKSESIPEHHATFPMELPRYFIQNFARPNGIILDPFLGSGTTAIAAKMEGRNYIGIEISEKYCQIARERLKSVTPKLL